MDEGGEILSRQAATALYNVTTAAAMAWEAAKLDDPRRLTLARAVLRHRLLPRDPLDAGEPDDAEIAAALAA